MPRTTATAVPRATSRSPTRGCPAFVRNPDRWPESGHRPDTGHGTRGRSAAWAAARDRASLAAVRPVTAQAFCAARVEQRPGLALRRGLFRGIEKFSEIEHAHTAGPRV